MQLTVVRLGLFLERRLILLIALPYSMPVVAARNGMGLDLSVFPS